MLIKEYLRKNWKNVLWVIIADLVLSFFFIRILILQTGHLLKC